MNSLSRLLPGHEDGGRVMFRRNGQDITLSQFRQDAASLVERLHADGTRHVVLQADDLYAFSVGLLGCLHAGVRVTLPPNAAPETLAGLCGNHALLVMDPPVAGCVPVLVEPPETIGDTSVWLAPFDAAATEVVFSTSGSSGKPKEMHRSLGNLEAEVRAVEVFRSEKSPHVFSTVSPMHAYGIIFSCLMPLTRGWVIECLPTCGVEGVLSALQNCDSPTWLVSSPAFMKLWASNMSLYGLTRPPEAVLSAGAPLPVEVAAALADSYGLTVNEVFGSTETGVVANRTKAGAPWTPFPSVRVESCDEGVRVYSPAVGEECGYCVLGDAIEMQPDGRFRLCGRVDRIVKIADKRLSLAEVEAHLRECPLVQECAAMAIPMKGRPRLAVAVVLKPVGLDLLAQEGYGACVKQLRAVLARYLDPVLLPRKWRFMAEIPVNTQSKVDWAVLQARFEEGLLMPWYRLESQSDKSLEFSLLFVKDTPCYAGHFPGYAIVPAVLFVHTMSVLLQRYRHLRVGGINRCKFCAEVHPGEWCRLVINLGDGMISFTCSSEPAGKCSMGRLAVEEA